MVLSLLRRTIRRRCIDQEAAARHLRKDGAIWVDGVMKRGAVRVSLETRRQAGRRVDGETIVVVHGS